LADFDTKSVHAFSFNQEFFVLDVNSGSLLKIDEPTFLYLEKVLTHCSLEKAEQVLKNKVQDISEIRKEVELLINEEILFSKSIDYYESELTLKSMCLNVAHACNFACKYCFAKKGQYGEKKSLMTFQAARTAIDFLVENSRNRRDLEIDFFGGEPLFAFDTVRRTIDYARISYPDRNFRFTITTNGSLLNEEIENYLYENNVSIVLSLDGSKEVNDKFRVYNNGEGTFSDIIDKIRIVTNHRKGSGGYYVRGTYTHQTLEISKTVMDLFNLGFDYISLEPVVAREKEMGICNSDLEVLKKEYEELADEFIETQKSRRWHFFHFNIDLTAGPCIQKRIHGCGAGVEYVAVSPNGNFYPCHQFDGIEETLLGNVSTGISNKELQENFRYANFLFNKKECSNCWARFYCSGGCLANNYNMNGNILIPYAIGCEIQKQRIEAALYVQYKLMEDGFEPIITEELRY